MYFARRARVSILLYDITAILSLRAERGKRCDTRFAVVLSEPVADADFPLSGVHTQSVVIRFFPVVGIRMGIKT